MKHNLLLELRLSYIDGASSSKVLHVCGEIDENWEKQGRPSKCWRYSIKEDKWSETGKTKQRRRFAAFTFHEATNRKVIRQIVASFYSRLFLV
jgi:hypothetical protein